MLSCSIMPHSHIYIIMNPIACILGTLGLNWPAVNPKCIMIIAQPSRVFLSMTLILPEERISKRHCVRSRLIFSAVCQPGRVDLFQGWEEARRWFCVQSWWSAAALFSPLRCSWRTTLRHQRSGHFLFTGRSWQRVWDSIFFKGRQVKERDRVTVYTSGLWTQPWGCSDLRMVVEEMSVLGPVAFLLLMLSRAHFTWYWCNAMRVACIPVFTWMYIMYSAS